LKLSRFLALLLLIHALSAVAQTPSSGSKIISLPVMSPNTPQGTEGGFWKVDGSFEPILRLKNDLLKQSLSVTPILYFADGTPYPLSPVLLDPAGVAQVNIRMALQSVPPNIQSHLSNYGMAGISYQWSWPAVIATIQNIDEVASLTTNSSFHSDVRMVHATPEVSHAQVIRGQWWLPTANADGFVALENTSLTPKQASVQFLGHTGSSLATQQVALASHSTALIKLSTALGNAHGTETFGGVEIDYTGPDQGVLAYAGIEDNTVGYSASPLLIESHLDPSRPVHQVTLSAPGLKLGTAAPGMLFPAESYFKPYAYLHNVSANPLQVTLSLVSPGSGGAPQTYALGQVSLQAGQTSTFDFESQFSSANPLPDGSGHLTASFQGRDGDLQISAGSVDQTQSYVFEVNPSQQADTASRTLCFWSIEADNDSTITVWNYKATAQDLVLTLYYFHGQYAIPIHLGPLETYNLDMRSLVNSRAPDPSGAVIPSNVTAESGSAVLSGKGGETDTISVAVSASVFNVRNATCNDLCYQCNGATEVAFDPGSYAEAVGGTAQAQVQVTWNSGDVYTNPSNTTWSIGNSAIATVNTSGLLTGQEVGQTGVSFYLDDYPMYAVSCSGYMPCPSGNPGGGGQDTVQTPTSLKLVSTPPTILQQGTGLQHGCPPGNYGIAIDVDYQVLDQTGAPIASANMEPQELLTGGTAYTDIGGPQPNYPQSAKFTRADGTFDDVPVEKCPPVPVTTLTQFETQSIQILMNGTAYPVRTNTYSYSTTNLPNHGTITNGADINATQ